MKITLKHIALSLAFALVLSGCVSSPAPTPQQESALGEQQSRQVLSKVKLSKNRQLNTALRNVGTRIARASNRPDFKWRYYLVDNAKQANAFVLPGGESICLYRFI